MEGTRSYQIFVPTLQCTYGSRGGLLRQQQHSYRVESVSQVHCGEQVFPGFPGCASGGIIRRHYFKLRLVLNSA